MKTLLSLIGILVLSITTFTTLGSVSALGPPACYSDNSCTEEEKCESENVDRNWPVDTGYHQDCNSVLPFFGDKQWVAIVGVVLIVATVLSLLRIKKINPVAWQQWRIGAKKKKAMLISIALAGVVAGILVLFFVYSAQQEPATRCGAIRSEVNSASKENLNYEPPAEYFNCIGIP